jgi:hypothetical protein
MNKRLLILFAFIISMVGISYANSGVNSNSPNASVQVITNKVRYVGIDTAICGAEIINPNGENIISAGVCWSKNPNPTVNDFKVIRQGSTNSFTSIIKNLQAKTGYFARAYVETSNGVVYGQECSFATDSIRMGLFMKGGLLFYVMKPGDPGYVEGEFHGLVVTKTFSPSMEWSIAVDTFLGVTDSAIFLGKANTEKIVNALGAGNYAAKYCYDLVYNGYTDWYLPTSLELNLMSKSGVSSGVAWSSTEISTTQAKFASGQRTRHGLKTSKQRVKAIRSF